LRAEVAELTDKLSKLPTLMGDTPNRVRSKSIYSIRNGVELGKKVFNNSSAQPRINDLHGAKLNLEGYTIPKAFRSKATDDLCAEKETARQGDLIDLCNACSRFLVPVDTSNQSEFGLGFDVDVVMIPSGWPHHFMSVFVTGEMKTNLRAQSMLEEALAQLSDRFTVLREYQIRRTVFWGFVTDLTVVMCVKATINEQGTFTFQRTELVPLFSEDRSESAKGCDLLAALLSASFEYLGHGPPEELPSSRQLQDVFLIYEGRRSSTAVYQVFQNGTPAVLKAPVTEKGKLAVAVELANLKNITSKKGVFPEVAKVLFESVPINTSLGRCQGLLFQPFGLPFSNISTRESRRIIAIGAFVADSLLALHSSDYVHGDISFNNIIYELGEKPSPTKPAPVLYAFPIDWACVHSASSSAKPHISPTPLLTSRNLLSALVSNTTPKVSPLDDAEALFSSILYLLGDRGMLFEDRDVYERLLTNKHTFWDMDTTLAKGYFSTRSKIEELYPAYEAIRKGDAAACLTALSELNRM
jgi:hypothetical protein